MVRLIGIVDQSQLFDSSFCPHCQGKYIIKYGKDNKGNQRYLCKECHKTFSSITGTLLSYTKKQSYQWFEYRESLFNGGTIKRSAAIAEISEQTALVWRHKILSILADLTDDDPVLSDTVYLDEKFNVVCHPDKHNEKKEKPKRGMSNQKRNIVCAIDQHNNKIIQISETGRIHAKELIKIYKDKIPSGKKDGYTQKKINDLHSSIDLFLYKYRGISDKYLRNYIGLYKYKDRHNKFYQKRIFLHLFKEIVNSLCALRFIDFNYDERFFANC